MQNLEHVIYWRVFHHTQVCAYKLSSKLNKGEMIYSSPAENICEHVSHVVSHMVRPASNDYLETIKNLCL
jgi:hypothetical protein